MSRSCCILVPHALVLAQLFAAAGESKDSGSVDLSGAHVVLPAGATDTERFAAREISRYLRLLCDVPSPILEGGPISDAEKPPPGGAPREGEPGRAVIRVGTAYLRGLEPAPAAESRQTYVLRVVSSRPPRIVVTGLEPIGVQYAAYALLEKLGVGFYLGGDALPERRKELLIPAGFSEIRAPVFEIRGSLPWYNFLNSPTTWDLEDFQFFFDQMAKMKCNFVGFHSYDSEPFCAYPWEGAWRMGAPAASSMTYGWGAVRHMKTDSFGFGTGRYFPYDVFGSRSVALASEPSPSPAGGPTEVLFPHRTRDDDAILRAQCSLAQGLEYAGRRGVKVCLGFELTGNPTDPESRRQAAARIRNLLASFPMLDYVWFWQSEGLGGGSQPAEKDSPLDLIVQRHRSAFQYLGAEHRISEAARVAAWVDYAHALVRRSRPDLRVIVSGWGGDAWMRFSDFYVGLDKVLAKDIIFAALDNIDPTAQGHVSEAYGKLSPEREKWPIPWFESDGGGTRRDQWGPQANVKPFTDLVRDARKKGCQGILGIHWQTRQIEEVAAYVAQFAWDPELSYEAFYETFARKCFGEKHGPEMATILRKLESLGPRWTGGAGQVECGGFQWFSDARRPQAENLAALEEIDRSLERIGADFAEGEGRRHLERLRYLGATIDWQTNFDRAAVDLDAGGRISKMVEDAESAQGRGQAEKASDIARDALGALSRSPLREAMKAYAARLTSQGDYGNLATINVKAYAAFLGLWERAASLAGPDAPRAPAPSAGPGTPQEAPGPELVVKFPPTALPEGTPFPVSAVAFGASPITEVVLRYRRPGAPWQEKVMVRASRDCFRAEIPAESIQGAGVEYHVEATDDEGRKETAPLGYPALFFTLSALPCRGPSVRGPYLQGRVALEPWGPAEGPAWLRATVLGASEYERCDVELTCGGAGAKALGAYHFAFLPLSAELRSAARLETSCAARDGQGREVRGPSVTLESPPPPAPPKDVAAAVARPFLARVTWAAASCGHYEVHRGERADFAPGPETLLASWPWTTFDDITVKPASTCQYAVVAVDDAGRKSEAARSPLLEVADFPLPGPPGGLQAMAGLGRVTLRWDAAAVPVSGYTVSLKEGDAWKRASGEKPLPREYFVAGGLEGTAERRFVVRAVDRAGRQGEPSAEIACAPLPAPVGPVFAASFGGDKAETGQQGSLRDKARVDGVLDVREGGYISYPGEEILQLSGPLSLELWASIDRIEGIPVLLSFGHWEGPGYWLQLIGGTIRFYLPVQKILDAGSLPTGGWHHIAATYDGETSRLFVDGKEAGSKKVGLVDMAPWTGTLRIGMYSDVNPQYQTLGRIDDVFIYQRGLTAEEVRRSFEKGKARRE